MRSDARRRPLSQSHPGRGAPMPPVRLFLCGDVMTGRGIDQILPNPCDPQIHEDYVQSAVDYVHLAERAHGPIRRPVASAYIWGDALEEFERVGPDARIINLETSITRSDDYLPKGINYRMSPENAGCLTAAGIDCCGLANNHVLDWGRAGLIDTLTTLEKLQIKTAGAGRDLAAARTPAILDIAENRRVIVCAWASVTSGTPSVWSAKPDVPGVNVLTALSDANAELIADQVAKIRRPGDIVVVSLHWGANWGYDISIDQTRFAHKLIEVAGASVVYGHSSHHTKAIEVFRNRLILYGCGDFLNDYEGIAGYEEFRGDLALMYFASFDPASGDLLDLELAPMQTWRFQLKQAGHEDIAWLRQTLDRESRKFGASVGVRPNGRLGLSWRKDRVASTRVR
jgi:poly-gamma-glutamate synthesis protein (capsule biosynthesis protein)